MPWPRTFLLWIVQQLGLGMSHSGLLAPFLWHSLGSWTSSVYTDWHRATAYIGIPSTYYGLSPTGPSTGRRMDGCIGIGRAATRVPFAEQYGLQWRSSRHWAKGTTDRVYFFVILRQVSRFSKLYRSHTTMVQFTRCMSSKKYPAAAGCVCETSEQM